MTWPRALQPIERHILEVLLSQPLDGQHQLEEQARKASAAAPCPCGCPTIDLAVDRAVAPAPYRGMVADGIGVDADGNIVGVLLFVGDEGYMSGLEVFAYGGTVDGRVTENTWGWPTVESFQLAQWEPAGQGFTLKNAPG